METILFKDLIKNGIKNVYIRSYGYTEVSIFGGTWQPFGNKASGYTTLSCINK